MGLTQAVAGRCRMAGLYLLLAGCGGLEVIPKDPAALERKIATRAPECRGDAQCAAMWTYVQRRARPQGGCTTVAQESEVLLEWTECEGHGPNGSTNHYLITRTSIADSGYRFHADIAQVGCTHLFFECARPGVMTLIFYDALQQEGRKALRRTP